MAMFTDQEDALIDYLEENYGCHTLILYGSRAIGYATEKSDWDVIGLYEGGRQDWCHTRLNGVGEVNAYLYPASMAAYDSKNPSALYKPIQYFLRLRFGRVLVEEAGIGTSIVQRAQKMYDQGPPPMPTNFESTLRHQYYDYYLPKLASGTMEPMEKHFHKARMMSLTLDNYFMLRGKWWGMSARDSFIEMELHEPEFFHAFEKALEPNAPIQAIEALVERLFQQNNH
jgi:hypothetical protein